MLTVFFYFQEKLSVGEDGAYLEGIHWRSVRSIGGGSCGRCFLSFDLDTEFLFAIKKVNYLLINLLITNIYKPIPIQGTTLPAV